MSTEQNRQTSIINPEWQPYLEKIESYVRILRMDDEILMQAITECTKLVFGYAENIKGYAAKFMIGAIEEELPLLRESIKNLEVMVIEARKRADENSGK